MASLMRNLINDFAELAENSDDLAYSMTMNSAVSAANRCHQMTPEETLNSVQNALEYLNSLEGGVVNAEAVQDALEVVSLYREILSEGTAQ